MVYVLENDRISSVITELIIKKNLSGGEVRCYPNGQLALHDLAAAVQTGVGVPDLILLDLDMPLMDGWEFLEALAGLPAAQAVSVFVLTSSIHPDDLARANSFRAVSGYFTKPLDGDSIVRMQVLLEDIQARTVGATRIPISATLSAAGCVQGLLTGLPTTGELALLG